MLTPPDPVSQIGLALPTILLYEISIWTARMIERKREQERVASETQDAGDNPAAEQSPATSTSLEGTGSGTNAV